VQHGCSGDPVLRQKGARIETMTPETTPTIPASRIGPSSLARTSARHFQGTSKGRPRRAMRRGRSVGIVTISVDRRA